MAAIRELIVRRWPHRFNQDGIGDSLSLGSDGLGLDSIEIVEVITACEELLGRPATEDLFAALPLSVERIANYFCSSDGSRPGRR